MYSIILTLFFLAVFLQGGFFPSSYLFLGVFAALAALFKAKKLPDIKLLAPFLGLILVYVISALTKGAAYDSLLTSALLISSLLFWILLHSLEDKKRLYKLIVSTGAIAAVSALFFYCNVIPVSGMITAGRLQGIFQYANAAGIFFAACALISVSPEVKDKKGYMLLFKTALLLTQSIGAILAYLIGAAIVAFLAERPCRETFVREFAAALFTSALFAGAMYALTSYFEQGIFAAILVVLLVLISFKFNKLMDALGKSKAYFFISASGLLALFVFLIVSRGLQPLGTYIERIIHINDGARAMLHNPILGLGPGRWESVRFSWQSANYDTGFIHSSIMQAGVDAGAIAVIIIVFMSVLLLRSINYKSIHAAAAIVMIMLHSLMDITLSFASISYLLLILCYIAIDKPQAKIQSKVYKLSLLIMAALLIYLYAGQLIMNNSKQLAASGAIREAAAALEGRSTYYFGSYKADYLLSQLYYSSQDYTKLHRKLDSIPYNTSDVFYLRARAYADEGHYKEAAEAAIGCIELSIHQAYGYELAEEVLHSLSPENIGYYEERIRMLKERAKSTEHFWARLIQRE